MTDFVIEMLTIQASLFWKWLNARVEQGCVRGIHLLLRRDKNHETIAAAGQKDAVAVETQLVRIMDTGTPTHGALPTRIVPKQVVTPGHDGEIEFQSLALKLRNHIAQLAARKGRLWRIIEPRADTQVPSRQVAISNP